VVGYFQKNDHLYFAENFEDGLFFAPLRSQMILIPFEQSVKWSALITSEETPDSAFTQLEINKVKNILNLWCKRN
jgi:isochorismate synthase